ncbi:MAG: V-type ATP synthase subunit F [Crenarchaeota archaeon]|nr:V-type ATP synthase subunit F [Thermoproteota archaeon]MCR8453854.1 V-type ATP synthase subunit F [Thermoproteota archaeon]MCR8455327.1 V-type ATP synthase subunit F [Thermoproteota archaeon]MCR8462597.1 V-type ATP synthase subunit F [Thermoproteota archaeon]MCR8472368.1 V-type ATP synthase subunit F [Thermoproteota archaeon]
MSFKSRYKILFLATKDYEDLGKIFNLLGIDVKIVESNENLLMSLKSLLESQQLEYAVIFMPETLAEITRPVREKLYEDKQYIPAFLFLPHIKSPKFLQLDEFDELFKRVQGISIKQIQEQAKQAVKSHA